MLFSCVESIKQSLQSQETNSLQSKTVQRPQTTSTVARRMVGHALGIKIGVSPEQNRQERLKLENAKGLL